MKKLCMCILALFALLVMLQINWSAVAAQQGGFIDFNNGDFRAMETFGRLNYATRESATIVLNSPPANPQIADQQAILAVLYRTAWEVSIYMGGSTPPVRLKSNQRTTVTADTTMLESLQVVVQQVQLQNGEVFDIWTLATAGKYPDEASFGAAFEHAFGISLQAFRESLDPKYQNMSYSDILDSIRKFSLVGIAFKIGETGIPFTPEFGNPEIIGTTLEGIQVTVPGNGGYELIAISYDALVTTGTDNTDLNKSTGGVYLGGLALNPTLAIIVLASIVVVLSMLFTIRRTAL